MGNVPPHLIVNISGNDAEALLAEWRWLTGEDKHVLITTASGDVFVADPAGNVFWLETGSGRLTQVACSVLAFEAALEDPSIQREWLLAPVVETLRNSGKVLRPGECYGFRVPAVLGGAYDGDNRVVIGAHEHFGFTGYLHNQMKDLPDGAQVRLKWVDR